MKKKKIKKPIVTKKSQSRKLNGKQTLFAQFYDGDAKKAAIKAGYKKTDAAARGCRLLKKPAVIKLIRSRQTAVKEITNRLLKARATSEVKKIMTRNGRMQFLSDMAQDISLEPRDRIKSVEVLGRMCGDFLGKDDTLLTRTTVYNILVEARQQRGLPIKGQKVIDVEGE